MENVIDENSEEWKNLQKELDRIKYHGHLVTVSNDGLSVTMSANHFDKAMQEAAKEFIKNLK